MCKSKMGESECFSIDSGVRKVDRVMKQVKMGKGMMGERFLEEGRE